MTNQKKYFNKQGVRIAYCLFPIAYSLFPIAIITIVSALTLTSSSCNVYKFADISIPDSIKTVRVQQLGNKARYTNNQLNPQLSDKLRQKIVGQTRLTQVSNDNTNAHYDISGWVSDYSFSTSAISGQREATNRLTVSVHIILNNQLENKIEEFDVTRNFEFSASMTIQQANIALLDEMVRNLTDEIFNRIFSNWADA